MTAVEKERQAVEGFLQSCKPCFGARVKKGKGRGAKRPKPKFDGVDIDAIHFNPRWMKKREAA